MSDQESVRNWYERTTGRARRWLWAALAVSVLGGALFFAFVPMRLAAFIQTANGAVTIPVFGAIWIAMFIYIWLVPSREVGFRSLESIERTERKLAETVENRLIEHWEKELKPAVLVWGRLGARLERRLDGPALDRLIDALLALSEVHAPAPAPISPAKALAALSKSPMGKREDGRS